MAKDVEFILQIMLRGGYRGAEHSHELPFCAWKGVLLGSTEEVTFALGLGG